MPQGRIGASLALDERERHVLHLVVAGLFSLAATLIASFGLVGHVLHIPWLIDWNFHGNSSTVVGLLGSMFLGLATCMAAVNKKVSEAVLVFGALFLAGCSLYIKAFGLEGFFTNIFVLTWYPYASFTGPIMTAWTAIALILLCIAHFRRDLKVRFRGGVVVSLSWLATTIGLWNAGLYILGRQNEGIFSSVTTVAPLPTAVAIILLGVGMIFLEMANGYCKASYKNLLVI